VLLTELSSTDTQNIIIRQVEDNLIIHNKEHNKKYKLSLSMGITHFNPNHPCSIDELLTHADVLM
jgi:hypothetical protein